MHVVLRNKLQYIPSIEKISFVAEALLIANLLMFRVTLKQMFLHQTGFNAKFLTKSLSIFTYSSNRAATTNGDPPRIAGFGANDHVCN